MEWYESSRSIQKVLFALLGQLNTPQSRVLACGYTANQPTGFLPQELGAMCWQHQRKPWARGLGMANSVLLCSPSHAMQPCRVVCMFLLSSPETNALDDKKVSREIRDKDRYHRADLTSANTLHTD